MLAASPGHQIWGAVSTEIDQTYKSESAPEVHQGAAYWVVGTRSFDKYGVFSLSSQGYVSPKHEDLAFRPWPRKATRGRTAGTAGPS
jgi:hypothetical protein